MILSNSLISTLKQNTIYVKDEQPTFWDFLDKDATCQDWDDIIFSDHPENSCLVQLANDCTLFME